MNIGDLEEHQIMQAIRDGVADAIWRIATNATDMPCADFYAAIAKGAEEGVVRMPDAEYVRADLVPAWRTDMDAAPDDGRWVALLVAGYGTPMIALWDNHAEGWIDSRSGARIRPDHVRAWYALPDDEAPIKGET